MSKSKTKERTVFGHPWGPITQPKWQDVQFRGTAYTLIPNKNGGLCDIRPLNETSYQILSHKRGGDVRLVKTFLEDLNYVEQHKW